LNYSAKRRASTAPVDDGVLKVVDGYL